MKAWNPERELTALLDVLGEEVLAVPDAELAGLLHRAGGEGRAAVRELRRKMAAAEAGLHLTSVWPLPIQGTRVGAKPQ